MQVPCNCQNIKKYYRRDPPNLNQVEKIDSVFVVFFSKFQIVELVADDGKAVREERQRP